MGAQAYVLLAGALFCIGLYGLLTRKNAIGVLVSIELMANAVNINLVALARFHGHVEGQTVALFTTALTVIEVVVGLALVILVYRARHDARIDAVAALHG